MENIEQDYLNELEYNELKVANILSVESGTLQREILRNLIQIKYLLKRK